MVCLTILLCIFRVFSKRMFNVRYNNMWPLISICSNYNALQLF